ncbi:hypothetical protein [Leucobacter soli]|uniref:hypothetical protein n=1 Tax=Leucobacter soli TaxID=2812850 RepID=UPI003607D16C
MRIAALGEVHPEPLRGLGDDEFRRLCRLIGASPALGVFFARRRERLGRSSASADACWGRPRRRRNCSPP